MFFVKDPNLNVHPFSFVVGVHRAFGCIGMVGSLTWPNYGEAEISVTGKLRN